MHEQLKHSPPASAEDIRALLLAAKKRRESPEFQAKYNHKFCEEGRKKRGNSDCTENTAEDLRAIKEWNEYAAAWRKEHGKEP